MQGLLEQQGLTDLVEVDSAGTAAYHAGERADPRARRTARERGLELTSIARKFEPTDYETFDYVLAMDRENYEDLLAVAPNDDAAAKLHLFRSFDPGSPKGASVPDPYYGGPGGFDEVFDICTAACRGLLEHLRRTGQIS